MLLADGYTPQPHDLLQLDLDRFREASAPYPAWVETALQVTAFVVCRRGPAAHGQAAIGIRGHSRDQRWATQCPLRAIVAVVPPHHLTSHPATADRMKHIPALQALEILKTRWRDSGILWGPGGSIGFELATGRSIATSKSDLDVVIQAPMPVSKEQARTLCESSEGLPSAVDIRVETPMSGFSLREFSSSTRILLRLPEGSLLGEDPWDTTLRTKELR